MKISYFIIPLLLASAAFAWYWKETHPDKVEVTVTRVEKGDVEETVANTRAGTVKACRRAKMSPSIGGQISELPFAEGSFVKQGDVLLKVWSKDLEAEVERIHKTIMAAQDNAEAACLQADVAKRSADRASYLQRNQVISREEYDKSITESRVRSASCKAARANVIATESSLHVAEAQLKRTVLTAPFSGVIATINGELNEYVTPSPPGIQTPPVIDLIEPGCFLVTLPVDEVDAPRVRLGMPARVTLDAWRGRKFEAKVSRIGSYIIDREKQARTVDIELSFVNPADLADLLVGYSADADIILQTRRDVLRITSEAFLDDNHVLLFNPATARLEKRAIQKGLGNWRFTEVVSGLKAGDLLVTSLGAAGVTDGAAARLKAAPAASIGNKAEPPALKDSNEKKSATDQAAVIDLSSEDHPLSYQSLDEALTREIEAEWQKNTSQAPPSVQPGND